MPTQQQVQRQMQFDPATKNALRERGDDESRPHIVEHQIRFEVRATLDISDKLGRETVDANASGVGRAIQRIEADNRQLSKSMQRIEQKSTNGYCSFDPTIWRE